MEHGPGREAVLVDKKLASALALMLGMMSSPYILAQTSTGGDNNNQGQQLQDMRKQILEMQNRLDDLQQKQKAAPSSQTTSSTSTSPNPGINAGPLTLTFGGFTELAMIYRSRNETADVGSNFNTGMPLPNAHGYHTSEFRESARQSRLSLLVQGPKGETSSAEAYFESDFLGAARTANSGESNSYNPRLRHAYATYYNTNGFYVLGGQTWSLVTQEKTGMMPRQENIPLTIDAQYVPGFNWTRNSQLRFVQQFGKTWAMGFSVESPQANIYKQGTSAIINNPGGSLFDPSNNYSLDVAPDVVAKVAWDPGYGHYELFGIGRWFRDRVDNQNNTTFAGGGGGSALFNLIPKKLDFQASVMAGSGIGRYGSAQFPDATVKPNGKLDAIDMHQFLVGLTYKPIDTLQLYSYYGQEKADRTAYSVDGVGYGYGSSLYDNSGCDIEGSSVCVGNTSKVSQVTAGGWWKFYQGGLGYMSAGLQGSYTRREIFSAIGGGPDTNEKIIMASFRYYPYQK
jgi:hypothetical protein